MKRTTRERPAARHLATASVSSHQRRVRVARIATLWGPPIVAAGLAALGMALLLPGFARRPGVPSTGAAPATATGASEQEVQTDSTAAASTNRVSEAVDARATDLANRGTEALQHGDAARAAALYREALCLTPDDEDLHYNLGIASARLGQSDEALKQYGEALRLFPDYAEAHNNLGNLLVKLGKLDEGMEHLNTALRLEPDNVSAHNNLGIALQRKGRTAEAVLEFRAALERRPDFLEARFNLAHAYLAQNRPGEARRQFQEVLRLRPDFAPARRGLLQARQMEQVRP